MGGSSHSILFSAHAFERQSLAHVGRERQGAAVKILQPPVYARAVKGEGQVNAQPVIALNVEKIDTGLDRAVLIRDAEAQHGGRLGAFHVQREVPDILIIVLPLALQRVHEQILALAAVAAVRPDGVDALKGERDVDVAVNDHAVNCAGDVELHAVVGVLREGGVVRAGLVGAFRDVGEGVRGLAYGDAGVIGQKAGDVQPAVVRRDRAEGFKDGVRAEADLQRPRDRVEYLAAHAAVKAYVHIAAVRDGAVLYLAQRAVYLLGHKSP